MRSTNSLSPSVKAAEKQRFSVPAKLLTLMTASRSGLADPVEGKTRRLCNTNLQFCDHIHVWHYSASQAMSAVAQARSQGANFFARALTQLLTEAVELCSLANCPNHDSVSMVEEVCAQLHALCTEMSLSDTFGYYTLLLAMKQAPPIILAILSKQSDLWNNVKGVNDAVISTVFGRISNCRQHLAIAESVWIAKELLYQERIYVVKTSSIIKALNNELWQLWHAYTEQRKIVEQQHNFILQDLQSVLSNCIGVHRYKVKLTPFGSRISGLAGVDSDLDVSLSLIKIPLPGRAAHNAPEEYEKIIFDNRRGVDYGHKGTNTSSFILRLIRQYVNRDRRFYCLDLIQWARIPIIKLKHRATNIEVDICLDNQMGVQNTFMLREYVASDYRIHCLLLAVKHWAKQRCVNQSNNGTISTFSWCLLVLYYLHNVCSPPVAASLVISAAAQELLANCGEDYASLHSEAAMFQLIRDEDVLKNDNRSVGELFIGFFAFYGGGHPTECFDYGREAVNLRHPRGRCYGYSTDTAVEEEDEEEVRDIDDHEVGEEDDNAAPTAAANEHLKAGAPVLASAEQERGRRKASLWSIKITDPFLNWDLGRVVRTEEAMCFIVDELHRGMHLLSEGLSHPSINIHQVWGELCQRHPDLPNGFCICPRCSQLGHIENYCPQTKCSKCGRRGHRKAVCITKPCPNCKSFDHVREACPRTLKIAQKGLPDVQAVERLQVEIASEPFHSQYEEYVEKKKEVTATMRDFTTKRVCFFTHDGKKVLQQQYQEIKKNMKEGESISNYLRGSTLRFAFSFSNKQEAKIFLPDYEAIHPKGPSNGSVSNKSVERHTKGKVSSSNAILHRLKGNQDRLLKHAATGKVDHADADARLPVSPRPQISTSRSELLGVVKAPDEVAMPRRVQSKDTNGNITKPHSHHSAAGGDVHIVSPSPSSPVAGPQDSAKVEQPNAKPQKENRRRARRREYAKGRREETASATSGVAKAVAPKDG